MTILNSGKFFAIIYLFPADSGIYIHRIYLLYSHFTLRNEPACSLGIIAAKMAALEDNYKSILDIKDLLIRKICNVNDKTDQSFVQVCFVPNNVSMYSLLRKFQ